MIDINTIRADRQARSCKSDDCECNHCPKCGTHTLGWLDTFQMCQSCEQEEEFLANPPKCEKCGKVNELAGRFCEACLSDDPRFYPGEERDTPLAELLDDDQGVSDQFNPVSGEMD
jgi:hypothetical protein